MKKSKPWVHFAAVCGTGMGGMAIVMKKMGWKVTGSDIDIYPPMSDYLKANNINIKIGFSQNNISKNINLFVLGGSALIDDRNNPEFLSAQKYKIPIVGYGQLVDRYIIKKNSIVVAGTYGKTTITAMLVKVLRDLNEDVSYMIGGWPIELKEISHIGKSQYSVVEGDEYPSIVYHDFKSRFMYYHPKYLILTAAKWDHYEVFTSEDDYINRYIELVKLVPKDGLIIASRNGNNLNKIIKHAKCRVIRYSENDFKEKLSIFGRHNYENANAVLILLTKLGFDENKIKSSLKAFKGIKKRLELVYQEKKVTIISDIAQHKEKLQASIRAVRESFKKEKLIVILDPHASIFKKADSLLNFNEAFIGVDYLILRRYKTLKGQHQIIGPDIIKSAGLTADRCKYVPLDENIIKELILQTNNQKSVILFCSSGGWNGLIEKTHEALS